MEKVKSILTAALAIGTILFLWGWYAMSDYTWSKLVIDHKQKDGWVVGTTQANLTDISHPWTIFKQPIVRIAFIKPKDLIRFEDRFVLANVLWVDYVSMSRTAEEAFYNLFDCKADKSAFVEDVSVLRAFDSSVFKWTENTFSSTKDIAKIVCE